ncbi:ATP-binding protein [Tengunoibacter tsumagoiensis]|uniref:histidine kinase n=1 Tax=Tengunoibacter tsumagoiensis TaxID=2014871 RepID=A0A401ZXQ6_9CHLR|nr:ATP-binding protein [Tengunoibacter tsumagoiensis]GCE11615.1 histidine kinase [Tengunoibacter tsumagoiensis]
MQPRKKRKSLLKDERIAALNHIGAALLSEHNEQQLLHMIAQTAVDLIGARFAAFSLRPINEQGELLVPSEGNMFHLAEVIGVTDEQRELFSRMPLGGEGLLAPIFRYGVPVRVADVSSLIVQRATAESSLEFEQLKGSAQSSAFAYAHGKISSEDLQSLGVPPGHPGIRSFLGAPLLDHAKQVRGGLLLGHPDPNRFQAEDEALLVGLASHAAVALDNVRLYQAMHARVQELDAIFHSITDGVTLVDPHCRIVRENTQAQRLRHQLEASPQGTSSLDVLLYGPARQALLGQAQQDRLVSLVNENHEPLEYRVTSSTLYQQLSPGDPTSKKQSIMGAVIIWHDETETRRMLRERHVYAETEARRSLLQHILDELPTSVYLVHGYDARLVLSNHAAKTLWGASWSQGQSMESFLQENRIQIFRTDGRLLPQEQLATLQAVRQSKSIYQHQEIIRHADGSSLPVLVNAIALDARKTPLNLPAASHGERDPVALVVHQDVSALKEAEYLKDDFIGIAAHELRTPLAALQGFIELFQLQLTEQQNVILTAGQQESLQNVDQATRRLVDLTNDLLDVTRLQAGRLELRQEAMDLVSLVKRVVRRYQMIEGRHELVLLNQAPFLIVFMDVMRIEQVLTNLISNAIKYSPDGGQICISLEEVSTTKQALLSIQDQGIGIPVSQQGRIFSRFTRADNAQANGIYGTGLGLYLSREFIERHGGSIWFQSSENKGTTFFVALPLIAHAFDEEADDSNEAQIIS